VIYTSPNTVKTALT